jgi:N-acetylneuraminic acid mutarotase
MSILLSLLCTLLATTDPDTIARELRGEPVAMMPRGITSFGAEALDGWLYVFGGYHGEPHKYSKAGQSDDFLRLNLRDPRQFELLDGGVAVQGAQLAAHGKNLYRSGGMVARNSASAKSDIHSIADAAVYDTVQRAWSELPPLPEPRSSHDMEVVGDRLVALGGWALDGGRKGVWCSTAAVLDVNHPEAGWTSIPAPFQRRALSAARCGSRIAAIGGMDSEGEVQESVDVLDPVTGTWTKGPDFPGSAFGVAACAVEGAVLASGKDGVVWRLADGATEWTRAGSLAFPRFFHQMVADETGAVFVLGGIDDMRKDGRVRHVELLDPRRSAAAIVDTFEIPAPFAAKNRQGAFLRGNALTLFGGNRSLKQHDFAQADFQSESFTLDLATFEWKRRAKMPESRQTIAATLVEGGAVGLAIGGFGFVDGRARACDAGFRYSFQDDAWTAAGAVLPSPRTQFGLVEDKGRLWVFGGLDFDPARGEGDSFQHPTEVLSADLSDADGRFTDSGVRLTTPRRAFACAAVGGKAYLVGGMRADFEAVDECEAFDFATRTFTSIAAPRRTRISAELVALTDCLYLCGGSSRGEGGELAPDRSIERYDPARDAWEVVVAEVPVAMSHERAFALRDRLLLVSSHVDGPPTTRIVIVTP